MTIFEPHRGAAASASSSTEDLGPLPQWKLEDLDRHPWRFRSDLLRAGDDAKAFAGSYRGKLEGLASGPDGGERLFEAVRAYEALQDLMGGDHPTCRCFMRATRAIPRAPSSTATYRRRSRRSPAIPFSSNWS